MFKFFKSKSLQTKMNNFRSKKANNLDLKKIEGLSASMIYSKQAKKHVSEIKSIFPFFKELFKTAAIKDKAIIEFLSKDKLIKLKLTKMPIAKNSRHTTFAFVFEIKRDGVVNKYYVKYLSKLSSLNMGLSGINETIALDIISKAGFNIIPVHFSYTDKKSSFIFYEFQEKLIDAQDAYKKGLLKNKDISNLRKRLIEIQDEVNKSIPAYSNFLISKEAMVRDINPAKVKSFESLPVFIDFQNNKLYLYDPWLFNVSKKV